MNHGQGMPPARALRPGKRSPPARSHPTEQGSEIPGRTRRRLAGTAGAEGAGSMMRKTAACALALALGCGALAGCTTDAGSEMPDTGQPAQEAVQGQNGPAEVATGADKAENDAGTEDAGEETEPTHEHVWVADYSMETVDAVTEKVHHDAVEEEVVEDHTVCNVCKEPIDGKVEAHERETGHKGATTDVPIKVKKVVEEAYDEEKVVTPETTQLVSTTETCAVCGEQREIEKKTIDPADAAKAVEEAESGDTAASGE